MMSQNEHFVVYTAVVSDRNITGIHHGKVTQDPDLLAKDTPSLQLKKHVSYRFEHRINCLFPEIR